MEPRPSVPPPTATGRFFHRLLHTHDTPPRTAAAFAVGVFFGFSPLLGFHTILGLGAAFALRLNRVAVLLGIYSNLPWILPPYYTLTTLAGASLLGVEVPEGLLHQLRALLAHPSWGAVRAQLVTLTPLLWAFTLGSTLGAVALSVVAYHVSLASIVAHHRRVAAHHDRQHTDK
jgi:uncharacterized protein (DUF2062 family)